MATDVRTANALASDAKGLEALRQQAGRDPKAATREAARQFEALFMQQMLKSMRAALPQGGLLENAGTKLGTDLLDAELTARQAGSDRPGSLADLIARQLERQMGVATSPLPGSTPANASLPVVRAGNEKVAVPQTGALGFVQQHRAAAERVARSSGIPATYMLAQAALETGWGAAEIVGRDGARSNNLFGIKAGSNWKGATVDVMTTEMIGGKPQKVVQRFRAYGSYAESFADYAQLINQSPRYAAARAAVDDPRSFAKGLQQGGYATDPRYADKLARVIDTAERLRRQLV